MTDVILVSTPSRAFDDRPRTPLRRPGSIRRTTTMTMVRPEDWEGPLLLEGVGRDLVTPVAGAASASADRLSAVVARPDVLQSLSTTPDWPELQALTGAPAISGYRRRLAAMITARPDRERPLGTLLDDIAATTLISGWAMILKPGSALYNLKADGDARRSRMSGVCIGFSPDSDAFGDYDGRPEPIRVGDVRHADDPEGWHAIAPAPAFEMRRSRRIDAWREGDRLMIDAMFQDSTRIADGSRCAVHDYGLTAAFDAEGETLLAIAAEPRILPHNACPRAIDGIGAMVGSSAAALRAKVLDELRGAAGCTHLNDATRALAAAPWLARTLALAL